jgi:hypothetical protein
MNISKSIKALAAFCLVIASSLANAQVLEVNIWKPKLGGTGGTIAAAQKGAALINEAGGSASVGLDLDGSIHFVTSHENWADWAALQSKLSKSEAWDAFVAEWIADPAAELAENYLLNTPMPGGDGDVYQVFIWEPMPGRSADLYRAAAQAKALHEKDGAAVTIHSDQMGHLHYSMNFKTWEDWAKFQDADHAEFDAFMAEVQKDPSGALIEVYTASILD